VRNIYYPTPKTQLDTPNNTYKTQQRQQQQQQQQQQTSDISESTKQMLDEVNQSMWNSIYMKDFATSRQRKKEDETDILEKFRALKTEVRKFYSDQHLSNIPIANFLSAK